MFYVSFNGVQNSADLQTLVDEYIVDHSLTVRQRNQLQFIMNGIKQLMNNTAFDPPYNVSVAGHRKIDADDPTNDTLGISFSTAY